MTQSEIQEVIAAIATPPGIGGVGIVRVSGPDATVRSIAKQLLSQVPKPRHAAYLPFNDSAGASIDNGIALYFPAPHSFTGESVLEFQAHGGVVVVDLILAEVLRAGARMASPGEFSLRAYLNGKLDLLQAEAVCDLITAGTQMAARSATRSLQGEFSARVNALLDSLMSLRCFAEAAMDFVEEEIDFLADGEVIVKLTELLAKVEALLGSANQGVLLQRGATLAIVGEPNVGKSSLLNQLTQTDAAIVTPIAGTTRDALHESIQIDGLPIHLVDTAGLRDTNDIVEKEGVERSWKEVEKADCIILVWDLSTANTEQSFALFDEIATRAGHHVPLIAVGNKQDKAVGNSVSNLGVDCESVLVSAKSGHGVDKLRALIKKIVGYQPQGDTPFIARRRHVFALQRVQSSLQAAIKRAQEGVVDCMGEELRYAADALGELTGVVTADDLLGEIFSRFCVGK